MRSRRRSRGLARILGSGITAGLAVAACGLDVVGSAPNPTDPTSPSGVDASTAANTSPLGDAQGRCQSTPASGPGELLAGRRTSTVTIDGQLDDWSCASFMRIDTASAAKVIGDASTLTVWEVAAMWDEDAVYVAVRTTDANLEGNSADIYMNDSIEVYLDGDGVLTGAFGPDDHQYVLDHLGNVRDYGPDPEITPTSPFASTVTTSKTGWVAELRVDRNLLGTTPLSSGRGLGFDFTGNDGVDQASHVIWYYAPTCTCSQTGTDACCCGAPGNGDDPHCNTQRFGRLRLAP